MTRRITEFKFEYFNLNSASFVLTFMLHAAAAGLLVRLAVQQAVPEVTQHKRPRSRTSCESSVLYSCHVTGLHLSLDAVFSSTGGMFGEGPLTFNRLRSAGDPRQSATLHLNTQKQIALRHLLCTLTNGQMGF